MPRIKGSLLKGKPIVSVAVTEAFERPDPVTPELNVKALRSREYRALLDTGADITCVLPHVVSECKLVRRGLMPITSASGTDLRMSYSIDLGIWCEEVTDFEGQQEVTRTLFKVPGPFVAAEIRAGSWFDLIIGTDIISQYDLRFSKGGRFELFLD